MGRADLEHRGFLFKINLHGELVAWGEGVALWRIDQIRGRAGMDQSSSSESLMEGMEASNPQV